ncbi:hypothetical protein C8R43DRAFT_606213 [Mycena crocata]|nr:hypothetical protein C8R43DRAFT_606213 [Mycena crocata]
MQYLKRLCPVISVTTHASLAALPLPVSRHSYRNSATANPATYSCAPAGVDQSAFLSSSLQEPRHRVASCLGQGRPLVVTDIVCRYI